MKYNRLLHPRIGVVPGNEEMTKTREWIVSVGCQKKGKERMESC